MNSQACDRCHRRKTRCNKERPECSDCRKVGVSCVYSERTKEPTYRKEHVDAIERRLKQAEARNEYLSSELARVKSETSPQFSNERYLSQASELLTPQPDRILEPQTTIGFGNDLVNEVSFLASNGTGDRHFLGSTSGILFANLLRATINVADGARSGQNSERTNQDRQSLQFDNSYYKRSTSSLLPPEDVARKLVSHYLTHDHIAYPFLLPSRIWDITKSIYSDLSFYGNNAFEAFVFDMVLAIANANIYKYDWQMFPSAESHQSRAMASIGEVLDAGGIKSLQAILLLCQYRSGSSIQDNSASMWHLVGIAVRTVYELGLHRESAYPIKPGNPDSLNILREQEIRRRCFWCVFVMDRIVSIILGRPLAINIEDVDVELPLPENEYLLNPSAEEASGSLGTTSIFTHIVKYRLICGRIMSSLHGLRRSEQHVNNVYELRDSLAAELYQWWQGTRELNLCESHQTESNQQYSSFLSREWYEVLYRNAMLLLYRPSPMLTDITRDSSTLQNIFISAKQAVLLYASLHRSRRINYSWITLHSVFMAGLSYIYSVSWHFRERQRRSPSATLLSDPTTIEIVNDTRACSNVLVAISDRWNALRHCHEIFDRLSDAVLEDAIKLQFNTHQNPLSMQHDLLPPPPSQSNIMTSNSLQPGGQDAEQPYFRTAWSCLETDYRSPPQETPLVVDSEFRNCFEDLQQLYDQQHVDNPVIQLSQDWLSYLERLGDIPPLG